MTLIQCPECKKEISSKAKNCPNCGTPLAKSIIWISWIIAAIVIFCFFSSFFSHQNYTGTSSKQTTLNTVVPQLKTINVPKERLKFGSYGYADFEENKRQARENYLAQNPNLSEEIKIVVLNDEIYIGMSKDAVLGSWGPPSKINPTVDSGGSHEQWYYSYYCNPSGRIMEICTVYLYIDNDVLASWQGPYTDH